MLSGSWVSHIPNAAIEVHHYERTENNYPYTGIDYAGRIRRWFTDGWTDKRWNGVVFFVNETFFSEDYFDDYLELAGAYERGVTQWGRGRFDAKKYIFYTTDRLRAILTDRA